MLVSGSGGAQGGLLSEIIWKGLQRAGTAKSHADGRAHLTRTQLLAERERVLEGEHCG